MKAILELEEYGYRFTVEGEKIRYVHSGDLSDPAKVQPLLAAVRSARDEALWFLKLRSRKDELEEQVNHGGDELDELSDRVGQDTPEYDERFKVWEAALHEYENVCDQLASRSWSTVTLDLPADSKLPTIDGQRQELEDGTVRATYTREQLKEALDFHQEKFFQVSLLANGEDGTIGTNKNDRQDRTNENTKKGEKRMGKTLKLEKFDPLPTGEYLAEIVGVTEESGKFGDQFKIQFKILEPEDFWGRHVGGWCSQTLTPKSKLYSWVRAAMFNGAPIPDDFEFDVDNLIGKKVRLQVVVQTGEDGGVHNRINDVQPPRKPGSRPVQKQQPALMTPAVGNTGKPELFEDE